MKKRIVALAAAALLIIGAVFVYVPVDSLAASTIHISTVEQLKSFANKCKLDTYSKGLTVVLDNDLDLEGEPFTPIPTFMGTFNGNNHTIKGFVCANDGSNQGFFRYVESSGNIKNLRIEGTVSTENGQCNLGGIVGTNYGVIQMCSFSGTVDGLINVGGICGYNSGIVYTCQSEGKILGKQYTGGICGFNEGNVVGCTNQAEVNTEVRTYTIDITSLSLLDLVDIETVATEDNDTVIDTGGIVGGSNAVVKSCTNRGTVGYQHYGYNVGGIAGRQSGFLTGCVNYGHVYGRKDVAGICGQMEPHMYLLDSESLVDALQDLNDSISVSLSDLAGDANSANGALNSLKGTTDEATEAAQEYEDYLNNLIEEQSENDDDAKKEAAREKAKEVYDDTSNTINGLDEDTKDDILSGDVDENTLDKVKDSATENGGSTGSAAAGAVDRVEEDANNLDSDTIKDIQNGNVSSKDIEDIADTAVNSGAADQISSGISAIQAKLAEDDAEDLALEQYLADAQEKLSAKVSSIGDALATINDNLADATGRLAENLTDVNDKFSKVNRLLTRILTGDMTYYDDISELDTESDTDGKVSYCTNLGYVDGDENVGGIAGEMAIEIEFDTTEEVVSSGLAISGIVSKMYETRAVVRSCKNQAPVTGRKTDVGGIVGNNDLGIVFYCENYGDVTGKSENVGGIAGNAENWVMGCYSMCEIEGEEYVGGIVGLGTQVTDCLSMVTIKDEHCACNGAIAGYLDVTKENAALKNYYISDTLGAIDGISYGGKAEPITFAELNSNTNLPEDFKNLVITFEADDVTVKVIKVEYGKDISSSDIPTVPEKDGYTSKWEDFSTTNITESQVVEAVYYANQKSMESANLRGGTDLPIFILEGSYDGTSELSVVEYTGDLSYFDGKTILEAVSLTIEEPDKKETTEDGYTLRYLPVGEIDDCTLYTQNDDGSFSKLSTTTVGSYVTFKIPSNTLTLVCVQTKSYTKLIKIGAGAAAGVVVVGFVAAKIIKGKKRKATKNSKAV